MTIHSSESRAARAAALAAFPSSNPPELTKPASYSTQVPAAALLDVPTPSAIPPAQPAPAAPDAGFLRDFLANHAELEAYKSGAPLPLTGGSLTLPAVLAAARFPHSTASAVAAAVDALLGSEAVAGHLARSRDLVDKKLAQNKSIYGVSTGFGGSATTRTSKHDALGLALLQHQHAGVVPVKLAREADANYASAKASSTSSSSSTSNTSESPLPYSPILTDTMPPTWTRAALLIRLNSLLRGHSAASPELLRAMGKLLEHNITPVVPLRGSISASGDLSPLSYIAGALIGERGIFVWAPKDKSDATEAYEEESQILRAADALELHGLPPVTLRPKEHLAILNGTAFSCALGALCVEESRLLVLLGAVCTAFGTEAMRGTTDSFCAFIQRIRPHPGQIETGALLTHLLEGSRLATSHLPQRAKYGSGLSGLLKRNGSQTSFSSTSNSSGPATPADPAAEFGSAEKAAPLDQMQVDETLIALKANAEDEEDGEEETIDADAGTLRQDRYPLRTAPQWLGPQLETVQHAAETLKIECNSTTDNPLVDPYSRAVHHGGNFQALAITSALEPLRLSLFHVGKLLFAQATELQNPLMNGGGFAGDLAATNPSLNFFGKGVDIHLAAYVSELAYLANPVSTGVQSAEMHNQAVNSLALVSARYTLQALETLQLVIASYIYILCQAVDLRALQRRARSIVRAEVVRALAASLGDVVPAFTLVTDAASADDEKVLEAATQTASRVAEAVWASFDASAQMDARPRAEKAAKAATPALVDVFLASTTTSSAPIAAADALARLPALTPALATALETRYRALLSSFLDGSFTPSSGGAPDESDCYLPAKPLLGQGTRALYTFVRTPRAQGGLGIGMHGRENADAFAGGLGARAGEVGVPLDAGSEQSGRTVGGEIGLICEAIRDGRMRGVVAGMFEGVEL